MMMANQNRARCKQVRMLNDLFLFVIVDSHPLRAEVKANGQQMLYEERDKC